MTNKKVKITTAGTTSGTWQIKITGIDDADLYDVEVAVLKIFGRKKRKSTIITSKSV